MVGPIQAPAPKQVGTPPGSRPEFGIPKTREAPRHATGSREWFIEILSAVRLDTDSFHEIARLLFDIKIEGWKTDTTIVLEFADILLNIIADRTANCGARKKSVNIIVPALVLGHPQNEWIFQALLRMTHDPALREIIHAALEGEVGFRMGIAKMDRQDWKTRYPDVKYSNELVSVLDKGSEHPYTDLNPSLMRPGTKLECLLKACEMHASGTCPECEGT